MSKCQVTALKLGGDIRGQDLHTQTATALKFRIRVPVWLSLYVSFFLLILGFLRILFQLKSSSHKNKLAETQISMLPWCLQPIRYCRFSS